MDAELPARVAAVRSFNRFYTRQIGLLEEGLLDTRFSLTEARVLYELGRGSGTASALAAGLDLDHGYLSRILRGFAKDGLIAKKRVPHDRRQTLLALTAAGRAALRTLDRRSGESVAALIDPLSEAEQRRMVAAMQAIEEAFGPPRAEAPQFVLRPHRIGDMGTIVARHAALYAQEYGWDSPLFEALVADIAAEFLKNFDAARERCWIAEMDGAPAGSVLLVKGNDDTARLRLLLVEPKARGYGLGRRLVEACIEFARAAGYRRVTLWTHSILTDARRLYQRAGFRLAAQAPHRSFGHDVMGETWELDV